MGGGRRGRRSTWTEAAGRGKCAEAEFCLIFPKRRKPAAAEENTVNYLDQLLCVAAEAKRWRRRSLWAVSPSVPERAAGAATYPIIAPSAEAASGSNWPDVGVDGGEAACQ